MRSTVVDLSNPIRNLFTNPSAETDLAGIAVNRVTVARSTAWAASFGRAASVVATCNAEASTDRFIELYSQVAGKLRPNTTYTFLATYKLDVPFTSAALNTTDYNTLSQKISLFVHLNGSTRGIVVGKNSVERRQLRLVFTTPPAFTGYNTIRLYAGGAPGESIAWDDWMLVEGNYTGPYLDGQSAGWRWTGTANNSVSCGYLSMPNLLQNPSFEAGSTGWGGWNLVQPTDGGFRGSFCMETTGNGTIRDLTNSPVVPCKTGDRFYGEAWYRRTSEDVDTAGTNVNLAVSIRNPTANTWQWPAFPNSTWTNAVDVPRVWTRLSGVITIPAGFPEGSGSWLVIRPSVRNTVTAGTFQVDDIVLSLY